ncbi:MAG: glycosyltransferase family 39 protein [Bacteroidales bacterium]|nr:glycosyltransferase family 39 protein [Bacteroidales bacterium]
MNFIKELQYKPFLIVVIIALLFRLLAVIFSKGYAMMDDHYLAIEQPQQWVDKFNDGSWLPQLGADKPSGHSLFFTGFNYLLLYFLKFIGISDPQSKMFFIRLFYALWSMGIVYWGYKITYELSNRTTAIVTAWMLAIYWFFPFLSVRQMVEIHCIPFILWSIFLLLTKQTGKHVFFAGIIGAMSISVRFQTSIIIAAIILVLILQKEIKKFIIYSLGVLICFLTLQGLIDFIIWKKPFAELTEYIRYNIENRYNYFRGNWYNYIILIAGMLIPPLSFFILWGWLRSYKKYLLLFLPSFLFLLFHMYFPNRQERFILPIIPLIIIQGTIWMHNKTVTSSYWQKHQKLLKALFAISFFINLIVLIPLTLSYTKRSYVEAMTYLKNKSFNLFVIDDYNYESNPIIPRFYLNSWKKYWYASKLHPYVKLKQYKEYFESNNMPTPTYFIFFEKENLKNRIDSMQYVFGKLKLDTIIKPSLLDIFMRLLNKNNKNPEIFIYKKNE